MSVRRVISAALLASAAIGCGVTSDKPESSAGSRGVEASRFTLKVRGETAVLDPATNTTIMVPAGGVVTSSLGGIDCGLVGATIHRTCSATFAYGTTGVVLTASPDVASGYAFFMFSGACGLPPCSVDLTADRLVAVRFSKTQAGIGGHPNLSDPALHGPLYRAFAAGEPGALQCTACHGERLQGQGLAVSCTGCHPLPGATSGCLWCHSIVQDRGDGVPVGGRRAVALEVPVGTMRAHVAGPVPSNADCVVCHLVDASHKSGRVRLVDADTGALYEFVKAADLASDPDVSTFCRSCHDADGARRLGGPANPFSSGYAAPDVDARFLGTLEWNERYGDWCFGEEGTTRFVNSHHDLSDEDQARSGAKIECLSCHGAHAASREQPLGDPDAPHTPWAGTTSAFCLRCHSDPVSPGFPAGVRGPTVLVDAQGVPCAQTAQATTCATATSTVTGLRPLASCGYTHGPWWVDYTWEQSSHGPRSKRGLAGYSGAPGADLACTVCHDPHGSYSPQNSAGNPYLIRDRIDGTPYVDDGARSQGVWLGPPWNTTGAGREVVVPVAPLTVGWGALCVACHSRWVEAYDWHQYCSACASCHAHGAAFGETDWASGSSAGACP